MSVYVCVCASAGPVGVCQCASPSGAVSVVLDSLDDIQCLQECPVKDRDFLLSVLEDTQLHALLDVSTD